GETGAAFSDQAEFHRFSVEDYRRFWSLFLRWSELICTGSSEPVCTADSCETALFFPELCMSYVENLLQIPSIGDGQRPALTARHHGAPTEHLTRRELADRVMALSVAMLDLGIRPGDRVAAIAGNAA